MQLLRLLKIFVFVYLLVNPTNSFIFNRIGDHALKLSENLAKTIDLKKMKLYQKYLF